MSICSLSSSLAFEVSALGVESMVLIACRPIRRYPQARAERHAKVGRGALYATAIIVAVIRPARSGELINPGGNLDPATFPACACMGWCRRTGDVARSRVAGRQRYAAIRRRPAARAGCRQIGRAHV